MGQIVKRISGSLSRPDVRRNPLRALYRRIKWSVWQPDAASPWVVPFNGDMKIRLTKGGGSALVYYQGFSEPSTARLISRILKPGMTYVDIGAHFGELTLVAMAAVGSTGKGWAFEPNPAMKAALEGNLELNDVSNVEIFGQAVSAAPGELDFDVFEEPSIGQISTSVSTVQALGTYSVSCTSLNEHFGEEGPMVHLIKMDIEGAEPMALEGATNLLGRPVDTAPCWIIEWLPEKWPAFGASEDSVIDLFETYGYHSYGIKNDGTLELADWRTVSARKFDGNILVAKPGTPLLDSFSEC